MGHGSGILYDDLRQSRKDVAGPKESDLRGGSLSFRAWLGKLAALFSLFSLIQKELAEPWLARSTNQKENSTPIR